MSRTKLVLPKETLEKAIQEAEISNTFDNRSALYVFVAEQLKTCKDEKGEDKPLTPSVIYLRVKEYGIECKTPVGIRGIGKKILRDSNLKSRIDYAGVSEALKKNFPDEKLTLKILGGSLKAAVKLNCLECCGMDKKEAKRCEMTKCPMFMFNPFIDHTTRDENGKIIRKEKDENINDGEAINSETTMQTVLES